MKGRPAHLLSLLDNVQDVLEPHQSSHSSHSKATEKWTKQGRCVAYSMEHFVNNSSCEPIDGAHWRTEVNC